MKTRFLILTAIIFSLFLGINNKAYADACSISGLTVSQVTKNPSATGCLITIPVSFNISINPGNKHFALYFYNGTAPAATQYALACNHSLPPGTVFLGALPFNINTSGTNDVTIAGTGCPVAGVTLGIVTGSSTVTSLGGKNYKVSLTLTIDGPGACNTYGGIEANLYGANSESALPGSTNWHCGGTFFAPGSLPVTFEKITAVRDNNQIRVNWTTASETNCKEYVVEGSRDNVNWTAIGKLDSKAVNGTSSTPLDYSLSIGLPVAMAALGMGGLFLLTLVRSRWARALALVVIVLAAGACLKDGQSVDVEKGEVGYIRIAQYDKDSNTPAYSKVIKVVND
ncbi:hypothetical protein [Niabella drilacis]|uniref:Uncharacterized protein n=1 Tax=Niabella drilacis (strain DSM 25811 / CCM 8410 / CCUG 62505 / LMG 26954 / E90) TaxID=1285928 RepID=A0A1G6ZXF9_NIADE|nr:hypothetical protein [Niabella drilacis]SDE07348.1 hypothetical protein SAMN04487894_1204 [Niabella drilacis]